LGINHIKNLLFLATFWERQLHQNTVNRRIGIELTNMPQQFRGGRCVGKTENPAVDTDLLTRFFLVTDVDLACWIITGEQSGETGNDSPFGFQCRYIRRNFTANFFGDCFSIKYVRSIW
jgi:hypothetical protein